MQQMLDRSGLSVLVMLKPCAKEILLTAEFWDVCCSAGVFCAVCRLPALPGRSIGNHNGGWKRFVIWWEADDEMGREMGGLDCQRLVNCWSCSLIHSTISSLRLTSLSLPQFSTELRPRNHHDRSYNLDEILSSTQIILLKKTTVRITR